MAMINDREEALEAIQTLNVYLDEQPRDQGARMALSDALEQLGDKESMIIAAGLRRMVKLQTTPIPYGGMRIWHGEACANWGRHSEGITLWRWERESRPDALLHRHVGVVSGVMPRDCFAVLQGGIPAPHGGQGLLYYHTRQEAEKALCHAFVVLDSAHDELDKLYQRLAIAECKGDVRPENDKDRRVYGCYFALMTAAQELAKRLPLMYQETVNFLNKLNGALDAERRLRRRYCSQHDYNDWWSFRKAQYAKKRK